MQQVDYSTRERISTQAGAMDLDSGRLIISEAVKAFLFSSGLASAAAGGLALAGLAFGGLWSEWAWLRVLAGAAVAGGLSVAGLAGGLAGTLVHILVRGWYRYARRLEDWHGAQLRAYNAAGGQKVDRETKLKALTIAEPLHVLWVALSVAERIERGEIKEPSAGALVGPVWVGLLQAGELGKRDAEVFAQALYQVGLLPGRKKGHAGRLATTDRAKIIELVTSRAGRIRQLATAADDSTAGEEE